MPESRGVFQQKLTRFLMRRCVEGVMAGWALMLGLLWTDVGRVGSLLDSSDHGALALCMLAVAFASTGGAVAMGIAAFSGAAIRAESERRD